MLIYLYLSLKLWLVTMWPLWSTRVNGPPRAGLPTAVTSTLAVVLIGHNKRRRKVVRKEKVEIHKKERPYAFVSVFHVQNTSTLPHKAEPWIPNYSKSISTFRRKGTKQKMCVTNNIMLLVGIQGGKGEIFQPASFFVWEKQKGSQPRHRLQQIGLLTRFVVVSQNAKVCVFNTLLLTKLLNDHH